LKLAFKV